MAIVNVTYGHKYSGKLYSYNDPRGTRRVGDEIVVRVTHSKSGKDYKTLGTIRSTHGSGTTGEMDTNEYLTKQGIGLEDVEGGSLMQLPGFREHKAKGGTATSWRADARAQSELETEYRLLPGMTESEFKHVKSQIKELRYG